MPDYDDNTALIVVDVQNDFADPEGNLYVEGGEKVPAVANREAQRARAAGATVAYTQDWHPPETPHFEKDGGQWPVHCVRDTWGAEFHPDLEVDGEIVKKGTGGEDGYSGFTIRDPETGDESPTGLEDLLRSKGVENVVVVGIAGDVCVKDTVIDAAKLGFDTTVIREGTRSVNAQEGDDERAFAAMEEAGATVA